MAPAMATYEYEAKLDDIPVVDLARCGEEECLQTVRKACEEIGCFRVINHGIAPDVLRNADLVSRDVFSLPTETKTRNVPSTPFSGYIGGIPHVPFYESLGIGLNGAPHTDAIQKFSLLMWPHGNQNFCEIIEEFMSEVAVLSNKVHQIILASLGVGKYYDSQFDHGKAIFCLNMYDHVPPELPTESIHGLPPHTDGNTATLLYEDREGGGLQVRNKAGNWVEVKAIPNTFIAVMGDYFQGQTTFLASHSSQLWPKTSTPQASTYRPPISGVVGGFTNLMTSLESPSDIQRSLDIGVAMGMASSVPLTEEVVSTPTHAQGVDPEVNRDREKMIQSDHEFAAQLQKSFERRTSARKKGHGTHEIGSSSRAVKRTRLFDDTP